MKQSTLFSVAIPAFKRSFLKRCIASVLKQTYTNFELIIINDASPEDLLSVVEDFNDNRIKYFVNSSNCGAENVVDNWNKCLEKASGEYFVLLGDDDEMESNYLEEFIKVISANEKNDIFHCRSYIINENSVKYDLTPVWAEYESVYDNILHRLLNKREQFISDFVYRTSALKLAGGFYKMPLAWGSDDITSFILMKKNGIVHTNLPVFNYRRSQITISNSGNMSLKLKAKLQYLDWITDFLKEDPVETKERILKNKILKYLPTYLKKEQVDLLAKNIKNKGLLSILFYLRNRRKFKLSYGVVFYSLIEYLKQIRVNKV